MQSAKKWGKVLEDGGKLLSLWPNSNPLTIAIMKKYQKPNISVGANAVYFLSIGLETWCQYAHPLTISECKPQMFFAAKIIHDFFLQQRIRGLF